MGKKGYILWKSLKFHGYSISNHSLLPREGGVFITMDNINLGNARFQSKYGYLIHTKLVDFENFMEIEFCSRIS